MRERIAGGDERGRRKLYKDHCDLVELQKMTMLSIRYLSVLSELIDTEIDSIP